MRRRPATTSLEQMDTELRALRAENARLRRRLALHEQHDGGAARRSRTSPDQRAAEVRSMLRDRASRNP